jgi:V8-like Glu-specific endopeptidase
MKNAIPVGVKVNPNKGKPGGSTGGTAVSETPQPQFGKVFFTSGNSNYVCSGTATNSSNGDVVTTAGHCVSDGGVFVTNFAFVPAYNNNSRPYGTWTARALYTTDQWKNGEDYDYDAAFAVMNDNTAGQDLTTVTGGYPAAFGQPRGQTMKAYGYPAARPFNGQTLYSCNGVVVQDTYGGSQDQGLACNMTGGSSGGGWIQNGSLSSVTSFGYTGVKNILWGPYFGTVIQGVFNTAQGA